MFRKVYDELSKELSGENARNMAGDLWRFDRTCSFSEYYKSAAYCCDRLRAFGAEDVRIIPFPADGKTKYGTVVIQKAWDCRDAELHLLEPKDSGGRLLSYRDDPYCLAQGSPPTPKRGVEAEVVIVKGGGAAKDYRGLDVKGKIVFTSAAVGSVHEEASKQGAVGILSDCMATNPVTRPTAMDLPDATLWQTLRPVGKCFGFVLSPRQGQKLRELVQSQKRKGKAVRVRAVVDSRLYNGRSEMVSGLIRGMDSAEEVAVIAHLYEPGANDNASGAALALEALRSLNALLRAGRLSRPKRSIRVLLTHEFQSLNAYALSSPEEVRRIIAGVNVDFVGQDHALCGSTMTYQAGPDALPSFLNASVESLVAHFRAQFHSPVNGKNDPYFPTLREGYWGNDNFISDPSIGVPTVAFINWPDRFYHTSFDTEDKIHPPSIKRIGVLVGAFAYTVANAGLAEAQWFAEQVAERADRALARAVRIELQGIDDELRKAAEQEKPKKEPTGILMRGWAAAKEKLTYVQDREVAALQSVRLLVRPEESEGLTCFLTELRDEIDLAAATWQSRIDRRVQALASRHCLSMPSCPRKPRRTAADRRAAALVPSRKIPGIVGSTHFPKKIKDALDKVTKKGTPARALFWMDGKRNLLEVCRLARLDTGATVDVGRMIRWCELMEKAGVLVIRQES